MATIGLLIFFIGAACADSQNITIPLTLMLVGMALAMMGAIRESEDL